MDLARLAAEQVSQSFLWRPRRVEATPASSDEGATCAYPIKAGKVFLQAAPYRLRDFVDQATGLTDACRSCHTVCVQRFSAEADQAGLLRFALTIRGDTYVDLKCPMKTTARRNYLGVTIK
ncbi:hypothetical protein RSO01_78770 [Reyranella soli]|uniref:Uncharacterized protein n=1 Tax=Reyranella soli TaxID=1230389 RepID=A0A512NP29_9HYPH|nr:hypothetical protein RSO01_78770 [Reyranella soli]